MGPGRGTWEVSCEVRQGSTRSGAAPGLKPRLHSWCPSPLCSPNSLPAPPDAAGRVHAGVTALRSPFAAELTATITVRPMSFARTSMPCAALVGEKNSTCHTQLIFTCFICVAACNLQDTHATHVRLRQRANILYAMIFSALQVTRLNRQSRQQQPSTSTTKEIKQGLVFPCRAHVSFGQAAPKVTRSLLFWC